MPLARLMVLWAMVSAAIGATSDLTIEHLETIQAQTLLYEAQLARNRALQELQKTGADIDGDKPFNPAPPNALPQASPIQSLPQIIQITGSDKRFSALLLLGSGNQITVGVGGDIPGTPYRVAKITLNQVVVSNGETLRSLNFAG